MRCFWFFMYPHYSPSLALHSNINPNGFLYLVANPPTQPCYTLHQNLLSCQMHIFFIGYFHNSKIQRGNETCRCICCFILDFSCSSSMAKLAPKFASKILDTFQLFCMIWGIRLSPHLRAPHNSMPYIRHYFPSHGE